jgi:hypothetical protein
MPMDKFVKATLLHGFVPCCNGISRYYRRWRLRGHLWSLEKAVAPFRPRLEHLESLLFLSFN